MTVTIDELDRIRAEQTIVWDAVSEGWRAWADEFESAASSVSRLLIRLGGVREGQSVLDFGTGLGEPALTAAEVVGPTGRVVGVDLSPAMVASARGRAGAGFNVDFVVGDVDAVPGGHDVVLSRWALPLTGDHEAALRALRAALLPGGVLAAAVWGPPASVPMIALGFATVSRHLALDPPPPGGPGPFALADPVLLHDTVANAGFRDVEVTEHVVDFGLVSPDAFARFTLATLPPRLRERVAQDPDGVRRALVEAAAQRLDGDGHVALPSTCLCVRAVA